MLHASACHDLEAIFTDSFGAGFLHRSLGVPNVGSFGGVGDGSSLA